MWKCVKILSMVGGHEGSLEDRVYGSLVSVCDRMTWQTRNILFILVDMRFGFFVIWFISKFENL